MADKSIAAGVGVSIAGGIIGGLMRRHQREKQEEEGRLANQFSIYTMALNQAKEQGNPEAATMIFKAMAANKDLVAGKKGTKEALAGFAPLMEALGKGNQGEVSGAGAVKTDVNRVQSAVQSHDQPTATPTPMAPSPNQTPERPPLFQSEEAVNAQSAEQLQKKQENLERGARIMADRLNIPVESARARLGVPFSPAEKKTPAEGSLGSYILQKVSDAEAAKGSDLSEPERLKVVEQARQDWAKYGRAPKPILDTLPPQLKERVSELLGKQQIVNPTEEDIKGVIVQASTELRQEAAVKNQAVVVRINNSQGSEEDNTNTAEQLARGNMVPSMLSRRAGSYNHILAEADRISMKETGKHYNAAEAQINYTAATRFMSSMNSLQMLRFRGLADSIVNTIDEVKSLGEQLQQGDIQKWNAAKRSTILQVYGNTPQSALAAQYLGAINTLKEEFANLANGGYAPTEAAWTLANGQINTDYGVKDLQASLAEVQVLINYRMDSFDKQAPFKVRGDEKPEDVQSATGPYYKANKQAGGKWIYHFTKDDGSRGEVTFDNQQQYDAYLKRIGEAIRAQGKK